MTDEEIVRQYADMVYKIAFNYARNKTDADDIFSETFLKFFKKSRNFENEEHRKAYLIRMTINCAKTFFSKNRRNVQLEERLAESYDQTFRANEVLEKVMELPEKYRVVIHLFYYEDYSISQISKVLDLNENTVKTHLMRGKQKLKPMLKELI